MKNILRTAKFLTTYPPRHLNQLKTWAISLIKTPSGKNFAVLDIFFMRYL
jgi:hypothetical protein